MAGKQTRNLVKTWSGREPAIKSKAKLGWGNIQSAPGLQKSGTDYVTIHYPLTNQIKKKSLNVLSGINSKTLKMFQNTEELVYYFSSWQQYEEKVQTMCK